MISTWRRSFWKSLWFALRRIGKDKRARIAVVSVALGLLFVFTEIWLVFVLPYRVGNSVFQFIFDAFITIMGVLASLLISRSNRQDSESLNFSITGKIPQQLPDEISTGVCTHLQERCVIVASLVARAAGESYLTSHELPIGAEVVTRQVQNSLLRKRGLWQKLDPAENVLASAADGFWTEQQRGEVITWCEQLRLLRWTLRIDPELVPLAHAPIPVDYGLAQSSLNERKLAAKVNEPIRSAWDLRGERDTALEYFVRIIAELKARTLIPEIGSIEIDGLTENVRKQFLGSSTDYLVKHQTIEELSEEPLRLLGMVAHARAQYAGYLVNQLGAAEPLPFLGPSEQDEPL